MKILYFAWADSETGMNTIAFGTEENINDDCLNWDYFDEDYWDGSSPSPYEISDMGKYFNDDGGLCEDYLISTETSLEDIDNKLLKEGYVKDARLKNIGWG